MLPQHPTNIWFFLNFSLIFWFIWNLSTTSCWYYLFRCDYIKNWNYLHLIVEKLQFNQMLAQICCSDVGATFLRCKAACLHPTALPRECIYGPCIQFGHIVSMLTTGQSERLLLHLHSSGWAAGHLEGSFADLLFFTIMTQLGGWADSLECWRTPRSSRS